MWRELNQSSEVVIAGPLGTVTVVEAKNYSNYCRAGWRATIVASYCSEVLSFFSSRSIRTRASSCSAESFLRRRCSDVVVRSAIASLVSAISCSVAEKANRLLRREYRDEFAVPTIT